jgi:hypothetical protein
VIATLGALGVVGGSLALLIPTASARTLNGVLIAARPNAILTAGRHAFLDV